MIQVDNTLLYDVAVCDARAIARHVLKLRGTEEKVAADVGNCYHPALEQHFRGADKASVVGTLEREHRKLFPNQIQPDDDKYTLENCRKIMGRYCDVRPIDRFPFVAIEFEKTVGWPLAEGIIFYAKRDLLVQDKQSGMLAPLDHKTTGNITDWWSRKYRMCSQMSGYVWLTQQMTGQLGGECYVNAIETKRVPDSSKKCPSHKVPYSECGVEHVKFELFIYSRELQMLEAWKRDAIILAKRFDMLRTAFPSVEYLPFANRNGAFNDGCTFCEFKKWCSTGFNQSMQSGLVVYEAWEPWATAEGVIR
jgi:hypothetical protein